MGKKFLRGRNKHVLYEWHITTCLNKSHIRDISTRTQSKLSPATLHERLGHQSSQFLWSLGFLNSLSLYCSENLDLSCHTSLNNKISHLSFGDSTLCSWGPLDLIYNNVWSPSPIQSTDDFQYFITFVDHYRRYIWFYPLQLKLNTHTIFRNFKNVVEKYFNFSMTIVFSDGGGEYVALKGFLIWSSIQHLRNAPHAPQHNGLSKRRHWHIVNYCRTLLHQAQMS